MNNKESALANIDNLFPYRTFPHIFSKAADGPKGKRRFSAPATSLVKTCVFNVYVLPRPTDFTPKSSAEELQLATAGLGRRRELLAENWGHSQVIGLCLIMNT